LFALLFPNYTDFLDSGVKSNVYHPRMIVDIHLSLQISTHILKFSYRKFVAGDYCLCKTICLITLGPVLIIAFWLTLRFANLINLATLVNVISVHSV
jgi:hypothetical protein